MNKHTAYSIHKCAITKIKLVEIHEFIIYLVEFWYPQEKTWAPLSAILPSTLGTTKWRPPFGWSKEKLICIFRTFNSAKINTYIHWHANKQQYPIQRRDYNENHSLSILLRNQGAAWDVAPLVGHLHRC